MQGPISLEHAEARGTARGGTCACTSSACASASFGVVVSMVTAGVSSSDRSSNWAWTRAADFAACISWLRAGLAGVCCKMRQRVVHTHKPLPCLLFWANGSVGKKFKGGDVCFFWKYSISAVTSNYILTRRRGANAAHTRARRPTH